MAKLTELPKLTAKQKNMVLTALQIRRESCDENDETKESREWQKIIDIFKGQGR